MLKAISLKNGGIKGHASKFLPSEVAESSLLIEHRNDFVVYSAVEPDSLIAGVRHFFNIFVIRLHVVVELSQSFQTIKY